MAILQKNYPLTENLQRGGTRSGFRFRHHGLHNTACLWLADTQFSYAGAQCAAVESKDL
jgi:hypothetical protein